MLAQHALHQLWIVETAGFSSIHCAAMSRRLAQAGHRSGKVLVAQVGESAALGCWISSRSSARLRPGGGCGYACASSLVAASVKVTTRISRVAAVRGQTRTLRHRAPVQDAGIRQKTGEGLGRCRRWPSIKLAAFERKGQGRRVCCSCAGLGPVIAMLRSSAGDTGFRSSLRIRRWR